MLLGILCWHAKCFYSAGKLNSIPTAKALAGPYALRVGLWWWAFGMCLAILYFVLVYRMFRGKITATSDEYGD